MRSLLCYFLLLSSCALTFACSDTEPAAGPLGGLPLLGDDCDPLAPTYCTLPFPSNVYRIDHPDDPSRKAILFGDTSLPTTRTGDVPVPGNMVLSSDGFSAGVAPFTHFPGATITGLPTPLDIEASLDEDCPTVLIEAETGKRVAHFAELDVSGDASSQAFMIRPVVRLLDETRYIVAIRNVVDEDGKTLSASSAFRALRDGVEHPHPSVQLRRGLYSDIFAKLKAAGVVKADLQIAWDFTTASQKSNTQWLLHMRDHALEQVGDNGPEYVIDEVIEDPSPSIARRIDGRMTVPLYTDIPDAGARLVFDDNGLPKQNGTAEYGFLVLIPKSVAAAKVPAPIVQFGHGLLGTRNQAKGHEEFADEYGHVLIAVDWKGMASDDSDGLAELILTGKVERFGQIPDRLCQGLVNALLAMRMARGKLAVDEAVKFDGSSVIDPTRRYYFGESQGGILGAVYMAISTDVTRGGLRVPGQPYSLLLNRSVDFFPFFAALRVTYPDPVEEQVLIALAQMLWDRAEPNGYAHHIAKDMLSGTPQHEVLMHVAIGDHQVTTLGAHVMARAIGAKQIKPATRPTIWGIDHTEPGYEGSAMVEFDFGLPPEPITNVPMEQGEDPHNKVKKLTAAKAQLDHFFRTGRIDHFCDGVCDPE